MKYILAVLLLSLTLTSCGQASSQSKNNNNAPKLLEDYSIQEIDSLFETYNHNFRLQELDTLVAKIFSELNGTLLIVRNDTLIERKTSGVVKFYDQKHGYSTWSATDLKTARNKSSNKLKHNTFYELASITKQFTAAAILKLVENEKLKLTDTLTSFFPELPYPNITIHHLLSHTSGLPEYFDFPVTYFDTSHLLTNQELITILIKEKVPSIFAPGYNYKYINTNYVLLASIVEKVADLRFEDFVRQNIFIPAGMTQTFFSSEKEENSDKSIAKGHLKNKSELPVNYLDGTLGDKGIYSNPEEMLKWKEAYFVQKKIIGTELLNKATSKQNYIKGKGKANEMYGYGLRIEETPEFGKLIYHGGLWRGYQNVFVYRPSDNTVIIFLSNYRNSAHLGKSNEILQVLDGA